MDPQLVESLRILPDESQKLIDSFGGLAEFLLSSPIFRTYVGGAKIGLKQDRALVSETLQNTHKKNPVISDLIPKKKEIIIITHSKTFPKSFADIDFSSAIIHEREVPINPVVSGAGNGTKSNITISSSGFHISTTNWY